MRTDFWLVQETLEYRAIPFTNCVIRDFARGFVGCLAGNGLSALMDHSVSNTNAKATSNEQSPPRLDRFRSSEEFNRLQESTRKKFSDYYENSATDIKLRRPTGPEDRRTGCLGLRNYAVTDRVEVSNPQLTPGTSSPPARPNGENASDGAIGEGAPSAAEGGNSAGGVGGGGKQ
ncbi:hypothetical protein L873DRAFT_1788184 [Choiromyces venosus 120613-1]|uniref:Uncharacterized protein n=1 Tax=Choiromyces venosus 120613-1 TaxID=1336337 RepID=A0A3N4JXD8_9PEZI|nr:hypothetical protein L873DRAFT_1796569 [Choiromyces venosus 120613-1]RPB01482.1 hypothetical protein L873DRAFT_1788184 [Choiromyces venosus 120613-1]